MSEEKKDFHRFDFKEAWIIAAASVLVVFLIGQLKPESELGAIATGEWLLAWMILLSFPTGLLFIFFIVFFTTILDYRQDVFDSLFVWAGLFATGYWQWCRFVPLMLGREIITLDLETGRERAVGPGRTEPNLSCDPARRPEVMEPSSTQSCKRQ